MSRFLLRDRDGTCGQDFRDPEASSADLVEVWEFGQDILTSRRRDKIHSWSRCLPMSCDWAARSDGVDYVRAGAE